MPTSMRICTSTGTSPERMQVIKKLGIDNSMIAGERMPGLALWIERLTRRRTISTTIDDHAQAETLSRSLSLTQLTLLGVGSTIGTGVFFALSETVPTAGPGVVLSFLMSSIVAGLTALCYAEIASSIPASGSSYTFAYVTMGEGVAFLIAGCLILEYMISAGAVAIGWAGYLNEALKIISAGSIDLPQALRQAPIVTIPNGSGDVTFEWSGSYMNVPAFALIWICSFLLMRGARESVTVNSVMVLVKILILVMFIVVASISFEKAHFAPFLPYGIQGVSVAAGTIFFSYIGLDAVSTASEEVVNPRRNIPLAIISSLVIVTIVYVGVAIAGLGSQPVTEFAGQQAVLAQILHKVTGVSLWALVMSVGAVISVFSITLVTLYGQTRILFAISRDGLLPPAFHRIEPSTQSPNFSVIVVATMASLIAGFVPASLLWDLVSIGTLVAFATVSAALIILRQTKPDIQRGYRVPFYPYLPIASILACFYIMYHLSGLVWVLFFGWLAFGSLYYFLYAARHSTLERKRI